LLGSNVDRNISGPYPIGMIVASSNFATRELDSGT